MANFTFIGSPVISRRKELVREIAAASGHKGLSINFGVKADTNIGYVEAIDFPHDTILTKDANMENIEIAWDARLDPDVINNVARIRRFHVDLGEPVDFITAYDMIEYLSEHLEDVTGNIKVYGRFTTAFDKMGTLRQRFNIYSIVMANENDKPSLRMNADIYYNKECVDKADLKTENKIYLNAYIPMYINKKEGTKYLPFQAVMNVGAYDMNNERQKKLYDFRMRFVDIKDKTYKHMNWQIAVLNGAEMKDWDESMLTDLQRESIELGLMTIDDCRPKRKVVGDRLSELRLINPLLADDFADGMIDTGLSASEFEENIYHPIVDEDEDSIDKAVTEKKAAAASVVNDISDDDIF